MIIGRYSSNKRRRQASFIAWYLPDVSTRKRDAEDELAGARDPGPGPGDLYDVPRLAERLGVSTKSLRQAIRRDVEWIGAPAGELNGGPVYLASTIQGIEQRRRGRGRPRRFTDPGGETPPE